MTSGIAILYNVIYSWYLLTFSCHFPFLQLRSALEVVSVLTTCQMILVINLSFIVSDQETPNVKNKPTNEQAHHSLQKKPGKKTALK